MDDYIVKCVENCTQIFAIKKINLMSYIIKSVKWRKMLLQ